MSAYRDVREQSVVFVTTVVGLRVCDYVVERSYFQARNSLVSLG